MKLKVTQYGWLLGSLCVWLLCAWVAQQPVPVKTATPKAHPASARPKAHPTPTVSDKKLAYTPPATTSVDTTKVGLVRHDPESGLALDETMPIVKGQCTVCHSSKLILQSHFDREKWVERIRWMQRTQKLWDLGDTEKPILAYLTKYYGPVKTPFDGRRLPLETPEWHKQTGR